MAIDVNVSGTVAPGLEGVADAFEANLRDGLDAGAACAVYVDGAEVVNLWGGTADLETSRPWQEDTLAVIYSATKGIASTCVHLLVQRGVIDVDRPMADYWPEFGANGKAEITVRMVLSHTAGLPAVDREVSIDDLYAVSPIVEALSEQAPAWEPGSKHGYHMITWGFLVGELVRRVDGRSIGHFLADEIASPLGLNLHIGLPADRHSLMSHIVIPGPGDHPDMSTLDPKVIEVLTKAGAALGDPSSISSRALFLHVPGFADPIAVNSPRLWSTEWPQGSGTSDARSLARLYAACVSEVDGVRLLSEETVKRAATEEAAGVDAVQLGGAGVESRFGLGFMLPVDHAPMLGEGSFGHPGAGGSLGFADPAARVGFGYVLNKVAGMPLVADPRLVRVLGALREALLG